MKWLNVVSLAITALGLIMVASGLAFSLSPTIILVGLMLIIAGVIKVVVVRLWHELAAVPNDGQVTSNQPEH